MQRHALAALFTVLSLALLGVAAAALAGGGGGPGRWLAGLAALAIGLWLGSLAVSAVRRR